MLLWLYYWYSPYNPAKIIVFVKLKTKLTPSLTWNKHVIVSFFRVVGLRILNQLELLFDCLGSCTVVICTKLVIDALFVVSINYTMCVCVFLNQACPLAVATCMYILYRKFTEQACHHWSHCLFVCVLYSYCYQLIFYNCTIVF